MSAIHDFFTWLFSAEARTAWFTAAVIFVSMLFSAWVAARVTRRTAAKLIAQRDFELRASAITTLVDAATEAAVWNSITPAEQVLSDRAVGQAITMIRMLPVKGSDAAASWAAHQLAELKRASASFGYELDPAVNAFRDRLVEWQKSPNRARRGFLNDLASWAVLDETPAAKLAAEQNHWVAEQHHQKFEQAAPVAPAVQPEEVDHAAELFAAIHETPVPSPAMPATAAIDVPPPVSAAQPANEQDASEGSTTSIWGGPQS